MCSKLSQFIPVDRATQGHLCSLARHWFPRASLSGLEQVMLSFSTSPCAMNIVSTLLDKLEVCKAPTPDVTATVTGDTMLLQLVHNRSSSHDAISQDETRYSRSRLCCCGQNNSSHSCYIDLSKPSVETHHRNLCRA